MSSRSILGVATQIAINSTSPRAKFPGMSGESGNASTTEANQTFTSRVATTFSNLSVNINATGTSRNVQFRKNGANGSQVVTIGDTLSGIFTDTTHTDSIVSGDTFDLQFNFTTGTAPTFWSAVMTSLTSGVDSPSQFFNSALGVVANISKNFYNAVGSNTGSSTEAQNQIKIRAPGKARSMQVVVSANSVNASSTAVSRLNTADGAQSITIGALASGLFEDSTNTDTLAATDLFCVALTAGSTAGITYGFKYQIDSTTSLFEIAGSNGFTNVAFSASTRFFAIFGSVESATVTTTESQAQIVPGIPLLLSFFRMRIDGNTMTGTTTFKLRKNGVDAKQNLSVATILTGLFEDTTNIDLSDSTTNLNYSISGGTSGNIQFNFYAITASEFIWQQLEDTSSLLRMWKNEIVGY